MWFKLKKGLFVFYPKNGWRRTQGSQLELDHSKIRDWDCGSKRRKPFE